MPPTMDEIERLLAALQWAVTEAEREHFMVQAAVVRATGYFTM